MSPIAASLRAARERMGWSREALAYHSGVSWSGIAQIESGRRTDIRLNSLVALARALAVSVDYLVGNASTPQPLMEHPVLVYESEEDFAAAVAAFLSQAIGRSEGRLVLTTDQRWRLLCDALGDAAADVTFGPSSTWFPSPAELLHNVRSFVHERLEEGASWIRIVCELPWTGRQPAEVAAWIRFESFLNMVFAFAPVTIACAYDARSTPRRVLLGAQRTHPEILGIDGRGGNPDYRAPEDYLIAYPG